MSFKVVEEVLCGDIIDIAFWYKNNHCLFFKDLINPPGRDLDAGHNNKQ
jgi:hypothetical protein